MKTFTVYYENKSKEQLTSMYIDDNAPITRQPKSIVVKAPGEEAACHKVYMMLPAFQRLDVDTDVTGLFAVI
tara:strand:- start:172 stop:387 length:216 start_codon:yes stop_codon:yes gene_type:complete